MYNLKLEGNAITNEDKESEKKTHLRNDTDRH